MSKVVKSIGRAISKVVKGVTKAVKTFAKSKIGRIIITAAAIYFGGAALAGGFGSSAAGGSFLSGMGSGISSAASSLSSAWTSALSGNFGQAASTIGNSWGAAGQAAGTAATNAGATAVTAATNAAANTAGNAAFTGATETGLATLPGDAANVLANGAAKSPGLIGGLSQMGQYAAISGATQLVGGAVQGYGAQKAQEDQRNYEQQQAANREAQYRASVDEFARSANAGAVGPGAPGQYAPAQAYDPVAEAQALGARYRSEFDARNPTTGLVARGMQSPQPMTNNNFTVYNPYYYRG
jgi:hypothetical protein